MLASHLSGFNSIIAFSALALESQLTLLGLSYLYRWLKKIPKEEFNLPEWLIATASSPFSRKARQWLKDHPARIPGAHAS